jgi:hypothetical protein
MPFDAPEGACEQVAELVLALAQCGGSESAAGWRGETAGITFPGSVSLATLGAQQLQLSDRTARVALAALLSVIRGVARCARSIRKPLRTRIKMKRSRFVVGEAVGVCLRVEGDADGCAQAVGCARCRDPRGNDHSLGWLEISVTHARNTCREAVASDDVGQNATSIAEITRLLESALRVAEALHATFAAFDAHVQAGGEEER